MSSYSVKELFLGNLGLGDPVKNVFSSETAAFWRNASVSHERMLRAVLAVGGGDLRITSANRPEDVRKYPSSLHIYGYAIDLGLPLKDGQPDYSRRSLLLQTYYRLMLSWKGGIGIAYPTNFHLHLDDRLQAVTDVALRKVVYPKGVWDTPEHGYPYFFVEKWSISGGDLSFDGAERYSMNWDNRLMNVYGLPKTWLEQFRESVKETISDTADDVGQWIDNRFDAILPDAGFGWGVFVGLGLSAAGLYAWHKHGPGLAKAVPLIVDAARTRKKLFRLKRKAR